MFIDIKRPPSGQFMFTKPGRPRAAVPSPARGETGCCFRGGYADADPARMPQAIYKAHGNSCMHLLAECSRGLTDEVRAKRLLHHRVPAPSCGWDFAPCRTEAAEWDHPAEPTLPCG